MGFFHLVAFGNKEMQDANNLALREPQRFGSHAMTIPRLANCGLSNPQMVFITQTDNPWLVSEQQGVSWLQRRCSIRSTMILSNNSFLVQGAVLWTLESSHKMDVLWPTLQHPATRAFYVSKESWRLCEQLGWLYSCLETLPFRDSVPLAGLDPTSTA